MSMKKTNETSNKNNTERRRSARVVAAPSERKRSIGTTTQPVKLTNDRNAKKKKKSNNNNNNKIQKDSSSSSSWYHFFTKGDPDYDRYMQEEWGFETHGGTSLFETLSLEGAQSGLSWQTILRKREAYRQAFYGFDVERIQHMTAQDVERLVHTTPSSSRTPDTTTIVRHRGKIESVIHNAKRVVALQQQRQQQEENQQHDTDYLDHLLWSFVNHQPILNRWTSIQDIPTKTVQSETMSQTLKKDLGFKFVGPTTCYAFMQAVGMVIDHPVDTPEWKAAHERLQKRPGGYQEGSGGGVKKKT